METFLSVLSHNFTPFVKAAWVTIQLTAVSLVLASVIGIFFALFSLSKSRLLKLIAHAYVGVVRGLPLIVQLMFLYFGIVKLIALSAFWAGSLALGIHAGAYVSEIFRGAIESIHFGQTEAAKALGMTPFQITRYVVFPQAFSRAIPPLGNQFIIGLKDSSLVAYLGINELFGEALSIQAENYLPFETYLVAGLYYLILVTLFTLMFRKLEIKLNTRIRKAVS